MFLKLIIVSVLSFATSAHFLSVFENPTTVSATNAAESFCQLNLDYSHQDIDKIFKFQSKSSVKTLNYSFNNIEYLDYDTFYNMPDIKILDLSNNRIPLTNLLSFTLPTLEVFNASNNGPSSFSPTESVPFSVTDYDYSGDYSTSSYDQLDLALYTIVADYHYPNLQDLYLQNVGAKKIELKNWEIFMPKLKTLDLSRNSINFIDVTKLTELETLKLDGNKFSSLVFVSKYNFCGGCNQICVGSKTNLKELSLSGCGISNLQTSIPYRLDFGSLTNLKTLNLSNNFLKTIYHPYFRIAFGKFDTVESLDLSNNPLRQLSGLCEMFPNLKSLFLNHVIGFQHQVVHQYFMSCLSNLKTLSLVGDGLYQIPTNFLRSLPKLEKLDLSDNSLRELFRYQESTEEPSQMKELYLEKNFFQNIEDLNLTPMKLLEVLDIHDNAVKQIDVGYVKNFPDKTQILIKKK